MPSGEWTDGAFPVLDPRGFYSTSGAWRNLTTEDDAAAGYEAFCGHYGIEPTRNHAGVAHENGSVVVEPAACSPAHRGDCSNVDWNVCSPPCLIP
jgi:hypothetical protein